LVEQVVKDQALQATGESHTVHAWVRKVTKGRALQAAGQSYLVMLWLKLRPKVELRKPLGRATSSML
jgi:hypothetical protein